MPELATTGSALLDRVAARLAAGGLDAPRQEALRLVAGVLRTSSAALLMDRDAAVDDRTVAAIHEAADRRAAGEPLAHVTGFVGFRHLELRCDDRALIPRPETEMLVDLVLERVRTGTAVDVGTGSGCLALSLATEGSFDRVVAIDSSASALALARANADDCGVHLDLVRGDLTTMLAGGGIDALVSNPPYLTSREYHTLDPSVARWEPGSALVSGADGLEATRRLLDAAGGLLRPGGWVALEVDASRAAAVARLAGEAGLGRPTVHRDVFGRDRYVLAQKEQ